jgi:MtN3 and saliva related transmembrane protein
MELTTLIGYAAAGLTTFGLLPQAIKAWQTRQTKDISLAMYLIMVSGISLWLVYGLIQHDGPLIAANSVSLVFASFTLYLKLKHK